MGQPKQLLPVRGKPALRLAIEAMLGAGIADVVVVLGRYFEPIREAIMDLPIRLARNDRPESDMAASVRAGLCLLSPAVTGVIVGPADHPLVTARTVQRLRQAHAEHPAQIIVPCCHGRRGHPSLFPLSELVLVRNGLNLREVIARPGAVVRQLEVHDIGTISDMDTWDDYQRLLRLTAGVD